MAGFNSTTGSFSCSPIPGYVSTFAGSGVASFGDGQSVSAILNLPHGVIMDSSGFLYVADYGNHRVRKINATGFVSTFAGSGTQSSVDGQGTLASISNPAGLAFDSKGNLFVSESTGNKIRKINPSGYVSTFAGSGSAAFGNGQGTSASFNAPCGIVIDPNDNIYVADQTNNRIRKISASGLVSTIAGSGVASNLDGQGTSATFYGPRGIALDLNGTLYVSEIFNNQIRKINASGYVSKYAGSGVTGSTDGQGTSASFDTLDLITLDSTGNRFVADRYNHKIRKVNSSGFVSSHVGRGGTGAFSDGTRNLAQFNNPNGIAIGLNGDLYVGDILNNRIRKVEQGAVL